MTEASQQPSREGWSRAQPEIVPRPTYWPAAMAFGITFILWGLITSWVVLLAGFLALGAALLGWIEELLLEFKPAPPASQEHPVVTSAPVENAP
jgi:hypothetical protein